VVVLGVVLCFSGIAARRLIGMRRDWKGLPDQEPGGGSRAAVARAGNRHRPASFTHNMPRICICQGLVV
jgi:hypothetical protein